MSGRAGHRRWHDTSRMSATERDYYELLGVPATPTSARSRRRSARSRASCTRTSPTIPRRTSASARCPRRTRRFRTPRRGSSTTATAMPVFARAASPRRTSSPAASATSSPRSSATTSSAAATRRASRGADVPAEIEIDLVDAARRHDGRGRVRDRGPCATCGGDGVEPGTNVTVCQRCGGHGRLQQVSRSVFGEFVRTHGLPRVPRHRPQDRAPCTTCAGAGRTLETRKLEVDVPAGIHDGQRIRLSGEGHAGALGGRSGDLYVAVRVRPTTASCARATTCSRRSTSRSCRRRSARPSRSRRSTARSSSSSSPACSPAQVRVLRGQRHAGAAGLRPRRPPRARQRQRAAPPQRRAAAAARRSSSA